MNELIEAMQMGSKRVGGWGKCLSEECHKEGGEEGRFSIPIQDRSPHRVHLDSRSQFLSISDGQMHHQRQENEKSEDERKTNEVRIGSG